MIITFTIFRQIISRKGANSFFVLVFLLFIPIFSYSQAERDSTITISGDTTIVTTTEKVKKGSVFSGRPGRSLLFSLVVPGAGQIYNKSYLRVPFVWAAVGGAGYFLVNTTKQYNAFRDAYISKIDMQPISIDRWLNKKELIPFTEYSAADLEAASAPSIRKRRDEANVNRQWMIVGFTLVWLANGIDAFVDAHLKDFDIDEDLSIDIRPKFDDDPYAPLGVGMYVKF